MSNKGAADYQRQSIGDAKSSLKPFGRRGTQRLDDESLIGLRVGSGILTGEEAAEKQAEKNPDHKNVKQTLVMGERKLQGQDSPPASHTGTLRGKS